MPIHVAGVFGGLPRCNQESYEGSSLGKNRRGYVRAYVYVCTYIRVCMYGLYVRVCIMCTHVSVYLCIHGSISMNLCVYTIQTPIAFL